MKIRISKEDLELGMHIDRAILDKSDNKETKVNFIRNVLIDTEDKLKKIKSANIKFVFVDTSKYQDVTVVEPDEEPEPIVEEPAVEEPVVEEVAPEPEPEEKLEPMVEKVQDPEPEPEPEHDEELDNFDDEPKKKTLKAVVPYEEELEKAIEIKDVAVAQVKTLLSDVAAGKVFEAEPAREQVNDMVKSVFRNKDALLSLTRLKSFDEYTFTHCVNVTALSVALAAELDFTKEEVEIIGFGAMLHDVGKMKVPDAVLNKPGKLTPEERLEIQRHTTYGKEILDEREDIHERAILMAYEHHEKADGTGYPCGKKLEEIQRESVLNGITDVYDALTSARVYKPGMPPPHALSFVKSRAESEFRNDYVDKFIEVVGIYPVGSVIEFNTHQIGIVKEVNRDDLYKPHVIIVMNNQRQKIAPKIVEPPKYDAMDLRIIRYHDPDGLGIDVEAAIAEANSRI